MPCGVCGVNGHNVTTCPHSGQRTVFPATVTKSRRCECCGQYGYDIQRHHTRGRADNTDFLNVCEDCHLECCHDGEFSVLPVKPRYCRITEKPSFWRA